MAAEREVSVPMTENASGGSMAEDVVYSIFNAGNLEDCFASTDSSLCWSLGVNKNVIIIMNVSFFLLICSLVALGFLWVAGSIKQKRLKNYRRSGTSTSLSFLLQPSV